MNIAFLTRGRGLGFGQRPTFRRLRRNAASEKLKRLKAPPQKLKRKKKRKPKKKVARGRAGIEPATSPTRRENHTSRPTALIGDDRRASNEDRTRDLVLTKHMLCQLSYRGDARAPGSGTCSDPGAEKNKKSFSTGFEPATPRFEVWCAIHCATRT